MRYVHFGLMVILLMGIWFQPALAKSEPPTPVAQVFGKNIFLTDLNPPAAEMKGIDAGALLQLRADQLAALIWPPVLAQFTKTHKVEPTETEVQECAKAMAATEAEMLTELKKMDKSVLKAYESGRNERYRNMVKSWKISKALYEEFGGTVIFQQANPMEPVGAYRKLLERHEKKGDFKILDSQIKQKFWEYYVREHPFQIPPKEVDFSKPWWEKQPQKEIKK